MIAMKAGERIQSRQLSWIKLLRLPVLRQLRALDLHDVSCDDQMAKVLLKHADNLPHFRIYDQLQSDSIRESLLDTFGDRMEMHPVPSYYARA
jgi:hypothetical protein